MGTNTSNSTVGNARAPYAAHLPQKANLNGLSRCVHTIDTRMLPVAPELTTTTFLLPGLASSVIETAGTHGDGLASLGVWLAMDNHGPTPTSLRVYPTFRMWVFPFRHLGAALGGFRGGQP